MAVGKNKGLKVGGKKGSKKKVIDPFTKKDWYDVKAPNMFKVRQIGKTLVNRTQGTRIASDGLKNRVYEVSLADLQSENDAERSFRKFSLVCEDVQGKNCLTNFHGMSLTTDKLKSMVKKWQTLIEANVDVKTTDGYTLRLFAIGFTKKADNAVKKTCYAKSQQVRTIRRKMKEIMTKEVNGVDLKGVVNKLIPDSIAGDILKACNAVYPLQDVYIRKVKVLRRPKFDLTKLLDLHGEGSGGVSVTKDAVTGELVSRPEGYEPPVMEAV
jgi:small subunit ribosomal protein S3Ae